jgi:hypothetical protein
MRNHTRLAAVGVLTVAGCLLSACSAGSSGSADLTQAATGTSATGSHSSTVPTAARGNSAAGSVSDMSFRIVNLYVTGTSQPGPALDIYDVQLSGQSAKPILTNVAYGAFSAYVHPHTAPDSFSKISYLEAMPAGEDPVANKADATSIGVMQDDGSHPQETILLADDMGGARLPGPLASLSSSTFVEKGDDADGGKPPVLPAPPAGDGQLLASTAVMDDQRLHGNGWYLMIDDSCNEPLNHDPNSTGLPEIFAVASATATASTGFALFPVTAATHQVGVVTWADAMTPTCAQLTPKQGTVSVDVTAGQNSQVFVYGTSLTDLHVAVGPIQP